MWDAFLIAIVPAVVVLFPSLIVRSYLKREGQRRWESFTRAGDYDVWPFFRRDDLEIAIRKPRLLTGTTDPCVDAGSDGRQLFGDPTKSRFQLGAVLVAAVAAAAGFVWVWVHWPRKLP
jgi:hypothetical protein